MRYEFTCAEHDEYGTKGWCPAWMRDADPLPGMGVAHDIMEHPAKDNGTVEDEIRAFGAALRIRHEGGWWHMQGQRSADWHANVSYEIFEFLRKWADGNGDWLHWYYVKRSTRLDAESEAQIDTAWQALFKHLRDEIDHPDDDDLRRKCHDGLSDQHAKRFRQLVREGYRMACKRFRSDPCSLAHVFEQISQQADKALDFAEVGVDRLIIQLNRTSLDLRVSLKSLEPDEY